MNIPATTDYVYYYTFDNSSYGRDKVFSRATSCRISRRCIAHDWGSVGTPGGPGPRSGPAPAANKPRKNNIFFVGNI